MVLHIFYEIVRKVVYKREGARGGRNTVADYEMGIFSKWLILQGF